MNDLIRAGERLDDLNVKGYYLIQDPDGFCFGLDAVLLVHFAGAKPEEMILDMGTGTGIIPILMAAYYPDTIFPLSFFDRITVNPPYMNAGLIPAQQEKAIARHEICCDLETIIQKAAQHLKSGGSLCMVHRPNRLPEVICLLKKYKLEPKRLRLVQPKEQDEPNLFLLEAVRGAKPYLRVEPTLVIYQPDGSYMPEVLDIYRY